MEEVGDGQIVVVQENLFFRREEPLPDRQAGSRHGRGVILHVELVGELIGGQFPHWGGETERYGVGKRTNPTAEGHCRLLPASGASRFRQTLCPQQETRNLLIHILGFYPVIL